jgi:hypothetical protein
MTTITSLNIYCLEYLKEFAGRKCYQESDERNIDVKKWHMMIVNDAFTIDGEFWGWLGGDERLPDMSEVLKILRTIGDYHKSIGWNFESNSHLAREVGLLREHDPNFLVNMYGYIFCCLKYDEIAKCIDDKTAELDLTRTNNEMHEKIVSYMASNIDFEAWINSGGAYKKIAQPGVFYDRKPFVSMCVASAEEQLYNLATQCVKKKVTFQNVVDRFTHDMSLKDMSKLKIVLKGHYPSANGVDLQYIAKSCIEQGIHPYQFNFGSRIDVEEWEEKLHLVVGTPKQRRMFVEPRRSERLRVKTEGVN